MAKPNYIGGLNAGRRFFMNRRAGLYDLMARGSTDRLTEIVYGNNDLSVFVRSMKPLSPSDAAIYEYTCLKVMSRSDEGDVLLEGNGIQVGSFAAAISGQSWDTIDFSKFMKNVLEAHGVEPGGTPRILSMARRLPDDGWLRQARVGIIYPDKNGESPSKDIEPGTAVVQSLFLEDDVFKGLGVYTAKDPHVSPARGEIISFKAPPFCRSEISLGLGIAPARRLAEWQYGQLLPYYVVEETAGVVDTRIATVAAVLKDRKWSVGTRDRHKASEASNPV